MGMEIFDVVCRFVQEKYNEKVPEEEEQFNRYLKTSLYRARTEYYRSNESGLIKIPKGKTSTYKNIEAALRMEEHNIGRELDEIERDRFIYHWFGLERSDYTEIMKTKYIDNIDETETLSQIAVSPDDPQDNFFSSINTQIVRDAVESVLEKQQQRTKECYRALFTVYCIGKLIDFEGLSPVLDAEILKTYQTNRRKPNQYDIYLKYHPEVQKKSADVSASVMLKTFLNDLYTEIKEKYPEIDLPKY